MKINTLNIREIKELDIDTKKQYLNLTDPLPSVYFTHQKTGFGERAFFICPTCEGRREKLYILNGKRIYCRSCSPISPYRPIQNSTRGGERELAYRMDKLAREYRVPYEFPFRYWEYLFDRPKYMRHKKWNEGLRKMQIMENMRFQNILYKTTYDGKLIDFIFENCLYRFTLKQIHELFIDWEGVRTTTVLDIKKANTGDELALYRVLLSKYGEEH